MSATVAEHIYDLIYGSLEELGLTDIYVQGDVPEDAGLPYATYLLVPPVKRRLSTDAGVIRRGVQIDIYARALADAEAAADAMEALVVGSSVAATPTSSVVGHGFELRDGAWRSTQAPEPTVDGQRFYRVSLLFQQDETTYL